MTHFDRFRSFYKAHWLSVLVDYQQNHYVWSSPRAFVLAKPVKDTLWIEYVSGDLEEMLTIMPQHLFLPKVGFCRRGKEKSYWLANITNKIL